MWWLRAAALTISTTSGLMMAAPPTLQTKGYEGVSSSERNYHLIPDGLRDWSKYYKAPVLLRNGHLMTIYGSKGRVQPDFTYLTRDLVTTPDGGTISIDTAINGEKRVLVLLSGLGGGSQDAYVKHMGQAAKLRGYGVAVVNMRGCAETPVTSPRFFSAYRGSTDDVKLAVKYLRENYGPEKVVALGWSNSASITINLASETDAGSHLDAACALAAPLDMPASDRYLKQYFHRTVYDKSIATGLADKFKSAEHLFQGSLPCWSPGGGNCDRHTFTPDVDLARSATTIRDIDNAITAPCFGFPSVDDYYAFSSPGQRLHLSTIPLLAVNAADDPIARWGSPDLLTTSLTHLRTKVSQSSNVVFAVTTYGGHLGWCDPVRPSYESSWIQHVALDFLDKALASSSSSNVESRG